MRIFDLMPTSKWFGPYSAIILPILLLFLGTAACAAAWQDPSKHIVRFIEVEPGVKVEVLDWGGSGEAVLLLAGHGDTGHVFDDFAPFLTDRFRVLAVTRRGFGASDQPEQGYNLGRLVEDIEQVVDALKLERVHLVGHSIAGDEMTRFALTFPNRTRRLIYMDAAYDRVESQRIEASFPKLPPSPEPRDWELGSPEAMRAFIARTGILMPESEIRATGVFGPDGRFLRPVTPDRILNAVAVMVEHPDYESVHSPMLAIYAVPKTPAQLVPRYKTANRKTRLALEKIFEMERQFAKTQRDTFRTSVPQARVVELNGTGHYIFISRREEVLRDVRNFLRTP
jgi:non-heme chloroperoxidase